MDHGVFFLDPINLWVFVRQNSVASLSCSVFWLGFVLVG